MHWSSPQILLYLVTPKSSQPLHESFRLGLPDRPLVGFSLVDILIQTGGDVNSEDGEGETPLHVASTKGHVEVVRRLIAAGADVNKKREDGRAPIQMASDNGHVAVVDILTHEGGDVNHDRQIG